MSLALPPEETRTAAHSVEAATPAPASLVIIGCGNLNRSDDGVGVRVIEALRERWRDALPPGVVLFDAGTGGMEVMFRARGAGALVIVDACRSGSEPGAVFRLPGSEIDGAHQPAYSLHDFRWDHAVHAGRRIFGPAFPEDLSVYLVEAASLELGTDLTPVVEQAVGKVCDQIAQQVQRWQPAEEAAGRPEPQRTDAIPVAHRLRIGDGRVLLPRALCDAHLAHAAGAALLHREGRAYLVPLAMPGAGGLLLKQRNAHGDRVLTATDFLAGCGLGPFAPEREFATHWVPEAGALWIEGLVESDNLVCTRKPG